MASPKVTKSGRLSSNVSSMQASLMKLTITTPTSNSVETAKLHIESIF